MSANAWHCVELEFSNEDPANPEAHASVDGQLVRSVTSAGDWHVPLGQDGTQWLNGMFNEVVLGWQSFSTAAIGLLIGGVIAAPIGAWLVRRLRADWLVGAAGVLLLLASAYGFLALMFAPVPAFRGF